jgi:multidrug transporter EmrE-like cation transporter
MEYAGLALVMTALVLQSAGKVLYGTFLAGQHAALFVFVSLLLTVVVSVALTRAARPRHGGSWVLPVNVLTATSFLCFYFALRYLPPAVVGAIEIGVAVMAGLGVEAIARRAPPSVRRGISVAGIMGGCALLAWTSIDGAAPAGQPALTWLALGAASASGVASALTVHVSRRLHEAGWSASAVLAHRFYLALLLAFGWTLADSGGTAWTGAVWTDAMMLGAMLAIGAGSVLLPLMLLQRAIGRTDSTAILMCLAFQPALSYALTLPSPAFAWNATVLGAVAVITLFVLTDLLPPWPRSPGRGWSSGSRPAARAPSLPARPTVPSDRGA